MRMLDQDRQRTLKTIQRLTDYNGPYNFYRMEVLYDYSISRMLAQGITDDATMLQTILNEAIPGEKAGIDLSGFGCTAFKMMSTDGKWWMGRNYDFAQDTSAMLVHTPAKENRFASVGFAALSNLWINDPLEEGNVGALTAPFICLDGVNENGVSIAVLTLDSSPVRQWDVGKQSISTSLAIRLVLDQAESAKHAVDLLHSYNMFAVGNRDYHFFITDATGNAYAVEYVFDAGGKRSFSAEQTVTTYGQSRELEAMTNFFIHYIDKVQPNQKNGIYGHGKERYLKALDVLDENRGHCTRDTVWKALKATAQLPGSSITSNTQWSIAYNNTDRTAEIAIRRDFGSKWRYDLKHNQIASVRGLMAEE